MLENGKFLIERYEILSKVGAGGMSDVYKAKDHVLGRIVAIKVLKAEFSEDVNFVTKFRTEAQSAAGLEHPNIVNIYDVGSENGLHFIVMEYVEGITLKTYIEKKGQLSLFLFLLLFINSAVLNTLLQVFACILSLNSFRYVHGSRIAGLCGNIMLKFGGGVNCFLQHCYFQAMA